jgi:hypothetical protein
VAVYPGDERETNERQPPLGDIIENAVRRLSTAIAIAGALIALAIYARPSPPHYEAFSTGLGIVRIDTKSGTVIGCEAGRCSILLRRGQRLEPRERPKELPAPAAAPTPAQAPALKAEPATNGQ